ncbi:MAG: hypothetical protein WCX65_15090 [bacterium]
MKRRTFLWLVIAAFAAMSVWGGIKAESKDKEQQICIDMASSMMPGAGLGILVKNPGFQKQLGITDEQLAKIREIANNYVEKPKDPKTIAAPTTADLREKMTALRKDLDQLVYEEQPDLALVDAKILEMSRNSVLMQMRDVHLMIEVSGVLNGDQRAKLKELLKQAMQPKKNGEKGSFGGPGGGRGPMGGPGGGQGPMGGGPGGGMGGGSPW